MTTDAEYLSQYDASRFPSPLVTVDSVLFTLHEGALCVLLVERANPPQQGAWGYPAGLSTRRTMIQPAPRRYVSSRKKPGFHRHGWSNSTPFPGRIAIRAAGA